MGGEKLKSLKKSHNFDNKMLENQLIQLGLNQNEARVYLAILQIGLGTAGPIVEKTNLHRMIVYNALKRLKSLRLVSVVYKNNRQHFQSTNPENILRPIHEREEIAKNLIPALLEMQSKKEEEMEVRILYGKDGFWNNLKDIIESISQCGGEMRILGGAPANEFYKAIDKNYNAYKKLLKKYSVTKLLLSPAADSKEFKSKYSKEAVTNQLRTMPQGLSSPTYTRITEEMVSIEIYTEPLVVIQIKNRPVAESYLEHFNLLWGLAV